jgi:hypothetical protein
VDDRVEPEPLRGAQNEVRPTNVHRPHLVRLARIHREDGRGVQDGVAALDRALDRARIGHVPNRRLDPVYPERPQRRGDALLGPGKHTNVVPGRDERGDRMRADIARSTRDQHQHRTPA